MEEFASVRSDEIDHWSSIIESWILEWRKKIDELHNDTIDPADRASQALSELIVHSDSKFDDLYTFLDRIAKVISSNAPVLSMFFLVISLSLDFG